MVASVDWAYDAAMDDSSIHPLLALTGDFLELLQQHPHVTALELRVLAAELGRWGGTIIEIEAWRRDPTGLDEDHLKDLIARVEALFGSAHGHGQLLQVACLAAGGLLRAAAKAGFDTEPLAKHYEKMLDVAAGVSDAHAFSANLSRFLLLEGVYDAKGTSVDHEMLLDSGDRRRKAEEMLKFISERLDPARDTRRAALEMNAAPAVLDEIRRIDIAQKHRWLSWETSFAAEKDGEKTDHPTRWITLSQTYQTLGDGANAAGALSNGLERFVEVWERSRRKEILDAVQDLVTPLREAVGTLPDELTADIRKVIARADLALEHSERAADVVRDAVATKQASLASAAADEFRRSYILRDADDWIGLAAAAGPDVAFEIRAVLRPAYAETLSLSPVEATRFLYPVLGRQRAGIVYWNGERADFLDVTVAHDVARVIDELHRHAKRDMTDYKSGTPTEDRWRELLSRLAGMLRFHELKEMLAHADVVLLLEGAAVHVPWPALLIAAGAQCRSVELRLLQGRRANTLALAEPLIKSAVTTNAFQKLPKPEQWHQALDEISNLVEASSFGWSNLQKPALYELALVGAHGRRQAFGDLSVVVGDNAARIAATELVERIAIGLTTFCGICFAGGGFLSGAGDWQSMPGLLLDRGAERVLANVWPAWDLPAKRSDLAALLNKIRQAPSARDAAETVTAWQQQEAKGHPRWWSGWGLWTVPPVAPA